MKNGYKFKIVCEKTVSWQTLINNSTTVQAVLSNNVSWKVFWVIEALIYTKKSTIETFQFWVSVIFYNKFVKIYRYFCWFVWRCSCHWFWSVSTFWFQRQFRKKKKNETLRNKICITKLVLEDRIWRLI